MCVPVIDITFVSDEYWILFEHVVAPILDFHEAESETDIVQM